MMLQRQIPGYLNEIRIVHNASPDITDRDFIVWIHNVKVQKQEASRSLW